MSDASSVFKVQVAAGNGTLTVSNTPTVLGLCVVRRIILTFPYGCAGLVGIQVKAANGYAFPNQQSTYLVFDDYVYPFDVQNQTNSGQWSIDAYNLDAIVHTIQVVYEFDYWRGVNATQSQQPLSL